jgi:hypothetical protein
MGIIPPVLVKSALASAVITAFACKGSTIGSRPQESTYAVKIAFLARRLGQVQVLHLQASHLGQYSYLWPNDLSAVYGV